MAQKSAISPNVPLQGVVSRADTRVRANTSMIANIISHLSLNAKSVLGAHLFRSRLS